MGRAPHRRAAPQEGFAGSELSPELQRRVMNAVAITKNRR